MARETTFIIGCAMTRAPTPTSSSYLKAENQYTEAVLAPVQPMIDRLYTEIVARLKQDDSDRAGALSRLLVLDPLRDRPGISHRGALGGHAGRCKKSYCSMAMRSLPGNRSFNWAVMRSARTTGCWHTPRTRSGASSIGSGSRIWRPARCCRDVVENVDAGVAWAEDNRTLLYVEKDPVTLLGRRIRRHRLGDSGEDALVYEEPDETFDLTVERSKSERYLLIASESTTSSEWRYAGVDDPTLRFQSVVPREEDHEYQLDHHRPSAS